MVTTDLLVRIDTLLGMFALLLLLATFYLVALDPIVGLGALVVVGLGLYALLSYVLGFLVGVGDEDFRTDEGLRDDDVREGSET
ncbi:hypothetical protein HUG10_12495 [Halorarum halophilum]|uniref:Uncharacterized protein n=1 Tax=Halorarum halophilum TaxID=2743090 RepID=A0A7D5K8M4_9EURY|nr:hypothetical protein [Halobaculum halophilum]QLG28314.1 hypothetical protein HUG10_12495 [Halobaculum halophilum]